MKKVLTVATLEPVKRWKAWHYKQYAREQSKEDQREYAEAEDDAREAERGLWRDVGPVAPWEFKRWQ